MFPRNSKTHKETTSDPDKYGGRYHETTRNKPASWQPSEMLKPLRYKLAEETACIPILPSSYKKDKKLLNKENIFINNKRRKGRQYDYSFP